MHHVGNDPISTCLIHALGYEQALYIYTYIGRTVSPGAYSISTIIGGYPWDLAEAMFVVTGEMYQSIPMFQLCVEKVFFQWIIFSLLSEV